MTSASTTRASPTGRSATSLTFAPRREHRARRRERRRQDHAHQAPHAPLRADRGAHLARRQDLRDWDERALLARFGVVFQDFNQYQFTLRENVGLGSVAHLDDEPRIDRARRSRRRARARHARRRPRREARSLVPGRDELSGGQWQKVALARAFMREEADVLVLDEPTAALDAEAEHAVFTRFRELARGRTTIVISHRFPTVRMASRIIVLSHGSSSKRLARGARRARREVRADVRAAGGGVSVARNDFGPPSSFSMLATNSRTVATKTKSVRTARALVACKESLVRGPSSLLATHVVLVATKRRLVRTKKSLIRGPSSLVGTNSSVVATKTKLVARPEPVWSGRWWPDLK